MQVVRRAASRFLRLVAHVPPCGPVAAATLCAALKCNTFCALHVYQRSLPTDERMNVPAACRTRCWTTPGKTARMWWFQCKCPTDAMLRLQRRHCKYHPSAVMRSVTLERAAPRARRTASGCAVIQPTAVITASLQAPPLCMYFRSCAGVTLVCPSRTEMRQQTSSLHISLHTYFTTPCHLFC